MIDIIRQAYQLLTPVERKQAYWCFTAMVLMAMVDVVGVASIMPFMAVISDPDAITHHAKLAWLYNKFGFASTHSFLIFLGLLVLAILVVGNSISMLTSWSILRFTYAREYSLSMRLFKQYLYQPYLFFINRNSSELSKNILSEVMTVINRAFIPGMQLVAKAIVTSLILLLLLIVDPVLAFVLTFILGGAYAGIYIKVRKKLGEIGKRRLEDNRQKYKIIGEAFGGIKDIKLLGRENHFIEAFSRYAKQHADDEATGNVIAALPRYALETIAFGGVLLITIYLLVVRQNISDAMPLLALYAFASFRLMPALQQIFTSVAFLRVSKDALAILAADLHSAELNKNLMPAVSASNKDLPFIRELELRQVHFSYPNANKTVIQSLDLKIPVNSTVGFVGMTGAGKTTIVDIILGLLNPKLGQMLVDDNFITQSDLPNWQRKIGYVPQTIFLCDDTITRNIAFGIADEKIDMQAIERATRIANIHDFIVNDLEKGYDTVVGDRGIRLSGGQRQRIGIARALYHDPDILVLDEATNALDSMTESTIMDAIQPLAHQKTILIVAHKLSTLKECDQIFVFEHGKIHATGTYDELIVANETFRALAGSG